MRFLPSCLLAAALLAGGCGFGNSVTVQDGKTVVQVGATPTTVGSGTVAKQEREVAGFRKVSAQQGVQVTVDVGDEDRVTVEADDNLLPLIETRIDGRTLEIRVTASLETANPLKVTVKAKKIDGLSASSGCKIVARQVAGESLDVEAGSGSSVTVDAKVERLTVALSSGSSVTAAGRADQLTLEASSGANFHGEELTAASAKVEASSGANAKLQVTSQLDAEASSGASVRYAGSAANVKSRTSSGGSVTGD
jgi:hypothetical protein